MAKNKNNIMFIRYQLLARMVNMWKNDRLLKDINRLPIELNPRNSQTRGRCCIYKERAVTKYICMAMMGFDMTDEKDEIDRLSDYVQRLFDRGDSEIKMNLLCVMDEACSSCIKVNYEVTNLCRVCVAQACHNACPKNAISYDKHGKAIIDHDICISCGKCHQACPYHAIVYIPVPCEEACPVKAISKDEYGIEHIDPAKCIYCGKCMKACPFGAIFEVSRVFDVLKLINRRRKIVAMVAPSILSQFDYPIEKVYGALKQIGFTDVVEVAYGAEETIRNEAEEFKERMAEGAPFMTTSCCSAYVQLVKKHIPELAKYVSTTGTPLFYTAKYVNEKYPDAFTVFIGPCASKRREGRDNPRVDFVWTFSELDAVLEGYEIDIESCESYIPSERGSRDAQGFAATGGVFEAVKNAVGDPTLQATVIQGIDKKTIAMLRGYAKTGKCPTKFIEIMSCEGGCIAGPCTFNDTNLAKKKFESEIKNFDDNKS